MKRYCEAHFSIVKASSGPGLFLALWRAWRAVEAADREGIRSAGFRSHRDFAILEALLSRGPRSIGELGEVAGLTSGAISLAIDRLSAEGQVERFASPADGRVAMVRLTEAGTERISRAFAMHRRRLDRVFSPLGSEEKRQMVAVLRKVRLGAEAEAADGGNVGNASP